MATLQRLGSRELRYKAIFCRLTVDRVVGLATPTVRDGVPAAAALISTSPRLCDDTRRCGGDVKVR
jgi:hypothetical protein